MRKLFFIFLVMAMWAILPGADFCEATQSGLEVTFSPDDVGGGWKVKGDSNWAGSGLFYKNPGTYTLTFQTIANYTTPSDKTVTVNEGEITPVSVVYTKTTGSITVTIKPPEVADKLYWYTVCDGQESDHFLSGFVYADAPVGVHTVKFPDDVLVGWKAPPSINITIAAGDSVILGGEGDDRTTYTRPADGELTVIIKPQAAVDAGAMWRVQNGTWQKSNATLTGVARGDNIVEFKDIDNPHLKACSIIVTVAPDTLKGKGTGVYYDPDQGVPVVFNVPQGKNPSQVFVHFISKSFVCGYYLNPAGEKKAIKKNTPYSLAEITNDSKAVKAGIPIGRPAVVLNSFPSGRTYISYDKGLVFPEGVENYEPNPMETEDDNYYTRYQYFESTCQCGYDEDSQKNEVQKVEIWTNLSYIDLVSIPLAMQAVSAQGQNLDQWTKADTQMLVNATGKTATPQDANIVKNGTAFVRVLAPMQMSSDSMYPDWNDYLKSLENQTTVIEGCFSGTGTQPTGDPLTSAQSYSFNATFNGTAVILKALPGSGNGDDICHGYHGTGVGDLLADGKTPVSIVIDYADLNSKNGIYGNNPVYTYTYAKAGVDVKTTTSAIMNDIFGWIVGDLVAGMSFGYPGSDVLFTVNGVQKKIKDLVSTQWWGGKLPGNATALSDTPAGHSLYFEKVQPTAKYYHTYAANIHPLTVGYGFGLQDRAGHNLLYYITKKDTNAKAYLNITINPDNHVEKHHVGMVNPWQTGMSGFLRGYDSSGDEVWNQAVSLPAYGRQNVDVSSAISEHAIKYLRLDTEQGQVVGYKRFSLSDLYRYAIEAMPVIGTDTILIPHIASDKDYSTFISLINTTAQAKTLQFVFDSGAIASRTVEAGVSACFSVASLFEGTKQPGLMAGKITNATGVVGSIVYQAGSSSSGMNISDASEKTLCFPHIAHDDQWWTGFGIYNPGTETANLSFSSYDQGGKLAGSPMPGRIPEGESEVGTVDGLNLPAGAAWLQVDSDQALAGMKIFGFIPTDQQAGYNIVALATKSGVFPEIDKTGWSGIAFVNTGDEQTSITLEARKDDGSLIASKEIVLDAKAKQVNLAEDLFEQSIAEATYIRFSSQSQDIVGIQLSGSDDRKMLDGLPALGAARHVGKQGSPLYFPVLDVLYE